MHHSCFTVILILMLYIIPAFGQDSVSRDTITSGAIKYLDSKLYSPVKEYSLKANYWLEALTYAAADFKIPMGIAWVDSPETKAKINRTWENTTVWNILNEIVGMQPGYELKSQNGVLHISPSALIPDRHNFLKIMIPSFKVAQKPIEYANIEFYRLLRKMVIPSIPQRPGSVAVGVRVDEPKVSLDFGNVSVEEIMDELILQSARKIWIVSFSADSALTEAGYRKTKSLYYPDEMLDENQPIG